MAAAIAIIKTAPAARSFVFFIASLYSGETKSANDSMDELIASADNTAPITITTAIHSDLDKPKEKPANNHANSSKTMYPCIVLFLYQ